VKGIVRVNRSEKKKKRLVDRVFRTSEKLVVKHPWFARAYTAFFHKMTIDEFAMVTIPKGGNVVNIGCGSLPHTLIILGNVRDWQFLGVDKDKGAAKAAKKLVDYYHLSNRIEIQWSDGLDFDVSLFDLIIVSHGVEPKTKLLEKLGKEMRDDCLIVYRTIWKSLTKVYGKEPVPKTLEMIDSYDRIDGVRSLLLAKTKTTK